jgi:hypothetical protein
VVSLEDLTRPTCLEMTGGLSLAVACLTLVGINPAKALVRSPESSNTKPPVLAHADALA